MAIECHTERHILTKDTDNNVAFWDILKACHGEDVNMSMRTRFKMVYVPNWFSFDLKTNVDYYTGGKRLLHSLGGCPDGSDPKLNLGGLLLQALLEFWPRTHMNPIDEEEIKLNHSCGSKMLPQHFEDLTSLASDALCK